MGAKENGGNTDDRSSDVDRGTKQVKEYESDYEPAKDSFSSHGETQSIEDNKITRVSRVPKKLTKKESTDHYPRAFRGSANRQEHSKLQYRTLNNSQKKSPKPNKAANIKSLNTKKPESTKVPFRPSSEVSEETEDKAIEEVKEVDVLDEAPNCNQSIGTDDETADAEENTADDDGLNACQKLEELELKIERLEEELREVASLEVSLYSVAPEHGSSSHKVHTPARRLSRLYIHACKYWSLTKRVAVAKNTVSGLVLISKSCGNDIPRLTFWLSNMVVLREIISQTFGNVSQLSPITKEFQTNCNAKNLGGKSAISRCNKSSGAKQAQKTSILQPIYDWQDTSTFTASFEKIESWIFSRIVELVWWQVFTPHMQTPVEDTYKSAVPSRLLGPALGDHQQGNFSINLWKSAFQDAFRRLCPLRAGGHECGCLPILAKLVMEQCIARLDVAMFNAILRESANEMPTDPVSDPIVDPKVLPIPAGDLSFGSGAQLKNSIGNWSRWLSDMFGIDADDSGGDCLVVAGEDDDGIEAAAESKSFRLLNELSDLLMLPKDMLLEKRIRKEVCPSISLPLVTRILCNFTPDEFCPDPVPGIVLEELNSESLRERLSEKDIISSFPYAAAPVTYCPPSPSDVAEKVADTGGGIVAELDRRASTVKRRGYTSDDDLDDLASPLVSIIDTPTSLNGSAAAAFKDSSPNNARYELLREVWS